MLGAHTIKEVSLKIRLIEKFMNSQPDDLYTLLTIFTTLVKFNPLSSISRDLDLSESYP